jgi:hypothetical protein
MNGGRGGGDDGGRQTRRRRRKIMAGIRGRNGREAGREERIKEGRRMLGKKEGR